MKLTVTGCTLLLCSSIIYGARYIAAAILNAANAMKAPGIVGMEQALGWIGWEPQIITVALVVAGLFCILLGWRTADE
jgi:hypothetical protein